MANFEINEDQAALIRELRKLETSDPVHANVYNALFEKLINNDAFLERLANKMIEKSMLCHVLDSVNAQQVLAADVGPKITAITNELKENVSVLNTNLVSYLKTQGAQVFGTGSTGWNSTKRTAYVTQNLIVPTITGYAPIGVLQWALGSDTDENYKYVSVSKINIMENGKLEVGIVNNSDYDATNLLLYVVFLYIKSL